MHEWSVKITDIDGKMRWAKLNNGKKAVFGKRQQARQFCRNRMTWTTHGKIEIHGPDNHVELFKWNGVCGRWPA